MEVYVLGAVGLVFAAIGFQRGWLREVATIGGLLASWLFIVVVGPLLVWLVNRVAMMIRFMFTGGFDSSAADALLRHLRESPLVNPAEPTAVVGVALIALVAAAYLASNRWVEGAGALNGRILGSLSGARERLSGPIPGPALPVAAAGQLSGPARPDPGRERAGQLLANRTTGRPSSRLAWHC